MKRGDYVVSIDNQDASEPSWDIGIVQAMRGHTVDVWWLVADETYPEARGDIREATSEEYEHARLEKGIDR